MDELLKKLNNEQRQAVLHENGPLLIVAGAGTGKTTVLINRLAYLILEKKNKPENLLLLTFTEKAAEEMTGRADEILPYGYFDLWINTFHSFGERILREHALDIGLSPQFKLLSQTGQWILIKKNLARFNLDYFRPLGHPTKFIQELIKHFSRLKDENIWPEQYLKYVEELSLDTDAKLSSDDESEELDIKRLKELANAYHIYNQLLLENNYLDFGDLIVYTLKLFKERANILKFYQDQFKYIMVDEFQDTNFAQYELVKLLASKNNNLVVVGDDDQAIYKFRGASISNIMQFKDDYPQALELVLINNYRSPQEVLDRAYQFIQNNNPNRLEEKLKINKKLIAYKNNGATRSATNFLNFATDSESVLWVVGKIKELYKSSPDILWSDFAILVRANDSADKYVKEFKRQGLPYQFVSLKGLYYKPLILDIIAYFKLLDNYHESPALYRVLNMDVFKVAYEDLVNLNKMARLKAWSLYEALKNISAISDISPEAMVSANKLLKLIDEHSALIKESKPSQIFLKFIYESGLLKNLDHDIHKEEFSYLNKFYKKIKEFEETDGDLHLHDFMDMLTLEMEAGETGSLSKDLEDAEVIKVMTIHGAKGLEFKYVFVVDLVDKRFPTIYRGDKIPIPVDLVKEQLAVSGDFHLEEERRLFYVAITRAKEELYLISAKDFGGARAKKPSRFIAEVGLAPNSEIEAAQVAPELFQDLEKIISPPDLDNLPKITHGLPDKFSFSQIAAYDSCPLQYKLAFILKIPAPTDKPSLIFGRVIHDTLREFLSPILPESIRQADLFGQAQTSDLSEKRALEIYAQHWQNDGYSSASERDEYQKKGQKVLQLFVKNLAANQQPNILFLEKEFNNFKIGGYAIKGKIDRIDKLPDGTLEIIDYKTGNPKEKLEFKDKKQLLLYQIFMEEVMGEKVAQLSFYYLENGAKISFRAKPKELEKLREQIINEISEIIKFNFAPTPGESCKFCDFNSICEFRQN